LISRRHDTTFFFPYSLGISVTMMDDELGGYDDYDFSRIPTRNLFGVLDLHAWMRKDLASVLGKGNCLIVEFSRTHINHTIITHNTQDVPIFFSSS